MELHIAPYAATESDMRRAWAGEARTTSVRDMAADMRMSVAPEPIDWPKLRSAIAYAASIAAAVALGAAITYAAMAPSYHAEFIDMAGNATIIDHGLTAEDCAAIPDVVCVRR